MAAKNSKSRSQSFNHLADENISNHPSARHLTEEQHQKVLDLSEMGSSPRDIIALLKAEAPNTHVISRDIYNILASRRQKLIGNRPLELLLKTLAENRGNMILSGTKKEILSRLCLLIQNRSDSLTCIIAYLS